jgi:hypothetical protein
VTIEHINIDKTPPTISGDRTPANEHGWNNADVTASYTASDALSKLESNAAGNTVISGEGADQSATYTVNDYAHNFSSVTIEHINIDKTKPIISGAPDRLPNTNSWYKDDVTVTFIASDTLSGVWTFTSPAILAEGASQSVNGLVRDKAGNEATTTVGDINIDKTAPVITPARDPVPYYNGWNDTPVTVLYAVNDSLSGIDNNNGSNHYSKDTVLTEGEGQSTTAKVYDLAGNETVIIEGGINIKLHGTGLFTWDGSEDTTWADHENWATHIAPNALDDVIIAQGANKLILDTERTAVTIKVENDATLDLNLQDLTITESFVSSGTVQNAGDVTVAANWTNTGVLTGDLNLEVKGDAGSTSEIRGATDFNDFTCAVAGKTLIFDSGVDAAQAIAGVTTIKGTADDPIILQSNVAGTQWHFDPKGERVIEGVEVKDSYNDSMIYIDPLNSIDGGNNTYWFTPPEIDKGYDYFMWDSKDKDYLVIPDVLRPMGINPSIAFAVDFIGTDEELMKRYRKNYPPGKYKTIVKVKDGESVVLSPYNQKGPMADKAVTLAVGKKATHTGVVR